MKRFMKAIAAIMLMTSLLFAGCTPEPEPVNNEGNNNGGGGDTNGEVTVITTTPQDVTSTSAVCGGFVSVSDGITLNEVGVCWGADSTLTVSGDHVSACSVEEQFTCTLGGLEPDTKYYVCAYALCGEKFYYGNVKDFTTEKNGSGGGNGTYNGHAYVDLGLPSGTLWATCNVGATSPEGYGDYFAWGETETKTTYDWSTYKYAKGTSSLDSQLTKYCNDSGYGYNGFTDNLTVLQPSDDAATANWGNGWCMPTKEQWEELYQNTTNTWMTQNGVNGRLFTAPNGETLFLPAAGYRWDDEHINVGTYDLYWSSMLCMDYPNCAWIFYSRDDFCGMSTFNRSFGLAVRAVRFSRQD